MPAQGGDRAYRCHQARPAYLPTGDVRGRDLQRQLNVDSSRPLRAKSGIPDVAVNGPNRLIGAIVGLVSLLLALVLGTLIGSAYAFYAIQKSELETFAAHAVQARPGAWPNSGPETAPARARIKETLQGVRDMVWGDGAGKAAAPDLSVAAPIQHLREMDEYVASLDPKTPAQR